MSCARSSCIAATGTFLSDRVNGTQELECVKREILFLKRSFLKRRQVGWLVGFHTVQVLPALLVYIFVCVFITSFFASILDA
jgi:hypothetical protein